jgi:hypothetical protein
MPTDVERLSGDGAVTEMNLPVALLPSVVDLLRNKQPTFLFFGDGRAHVTSVPEEVGESVYGVYRFRNPAGNELR